MCSQMGIQSVAKFERTLISNIFSIAKSQILQKTCQKLAAVGFQLVFGKIFFVQFGKYQLFSVQ